MVLVLKNTPTSAGDVRNEGSLPRLGRCPEKERRIPWTEEPDRLCIVHRVVKSWTRLEWPHTHAPVFLGSPGGSDGRGPTRSVRYLGSVPGLGRSLGKGIGNPLRYSHLEDSVDRGALEATVHGVTKSWT